MLETRFKQTEIGRIPKDWGLFKFGKALKFLPNNTFAREHLCDKGYIKDIHYGDVLIKYGYVLDASNTVIPYINPVVAATYHFKYMAHDGDVIIADTAEDEMVGKATELWNVGDSQIVAGLHTMWCHPYKGLFGIKYLGYFINCSTFHNQILPLIQGIKVSSVSKNDIQETWLLVPPLAEQERIASALTAVDNLLASLDKQIAKTRNLKQATMQHLLSSLPNHSPLKPLGEVCEFTRGQGMSKQDRGGGNIPIILYGELYTTYGNYINDVVSKASQDVVQSSPIIKKGDLLLPISSTTKEAQIGKVSAYCCDYDAYLGGDAIMLKHKQIPGYLVHLLNSPWFERKKMPHAKGITINHLDPKGLSEIKIPIPAIEQQQFIAEVLLSMDNQITALEKKRSKYEMVKQGMMQQLLTGTIRLI